MTAKTTAERQKSFRQAIKAAGYVKLEAYVTLEQRQQFRVLGGDAWLRKKIAAAPQTAKSPAPAEARAGRSPPR